MGVPGTDSERGLRHSVEGTVFYVDPNYTDTSDQRDGTNPTAPLTTVATALTKCEAYRGDIIYVMANNAWDYGNVADGRATAINEAVTVDVPGVRIVGVTPSGRLGVPWTVPTDGGVAITVDAIDVLIEGFCFMGRGEGETAILSTWDGDDQYGENLTVRHCFFDEDLDIGIELAYSWYPDIHDNVFEDIESYGIFSDTESIVQARIMRNHFHDCVDAAISIADARECLIAENWIFNSVAQGGAAATDTMIDLAGGSENIVCHNVMSCDLGAGAGAYDDCNEATATDAWIHNFLMDGVTTGNPA